jgi:hypothetical protein
MASPPLAKVVHAAAQVVQIPRHTAHALASPPARLVTSTIVDSDAATVRPSPPVPVRSQ